MSFGSLQSLGLRCSCYDLVGVFWQWLPSLLVSLDITHQFPQARNYLFSNWSTGSIASDCYRLLPQSWTWSRSLARSEGLSCYCCSSRSGCFPDLRHCSGSDCWRTGNCYPAWVGGLAISIAFAVDSAIAITLTYWPACSSETRAGARLGSQSACSDWSFTQQLALN